MEGSATFTIVTSRTIISCARQTTNSDAQRRRSGASVETRFMGLRDLSWRWVGVKMEAASEIYGGILRIIYGGPLRLSRKTT